MDPISSIISVDTKQESGSWETIWRGKNFFYSEKQYHFLTISKTSTKTHVTQKLNSNYMKKVLAA